MQVPGLPGSQEPGDEALAGGSPGARGSREDRLRAREKDRRMSCEYCTTGHDEHLAVISEVRMGMEDHYGAALMFTASISEGNCALQVIPIDDPRCKEILSGVSDVSRLNGRACWVDTSRRGLITFKRMYKR